MNDNQYQTSGAIERVKLGFKEEASHAFAFLEAMGFTQIESSHTIIKYQKCDLIVNIYHGRQSYEIGFDIIRDGIVYYLPEIIKLTEPKEGEAYRNSTATTRAAIHDGVVRVRDFVKRYAGMALRNDSDTFASLDYQRKKWAEALGLKTQAASLRPKAEEAFRLGHYAEAAAMYEQIRITLSPAETRKAELARERAGISR